MAHVDGVDRGAGHLLARLDARRALRLAIVSASASVGDGAQDVVVGPAPAEVAREGVRDLLAGRRRRAAPGPPGIVEGAGLDDEARGAEPALQAVERHEGALHGMQSPRANPLDGGDRLAGDGFDRQQAAHDRRAIEEHRTGAADARPAYELGSGEPELIAQDVDEQRFRVVRQGR